jgi:hypothetical protein
MIRGIKRFFLLLSICLKIFFRIEDVNRIRRKLVWFKLCTFSSGLNSFSIILISLLSESGLATAKYGIPPTMTALASMVASWCSGHSNDSRLALYSVPFSFLVLALPFADCLSCRCFPFSRSDRISFSFSDRTFSSAEEIACLPAL